MFFAFTVYLCFHNNVSGWIKAAIFPTRKHRNVIIWCRFSTKCQQDFTLWRCLYSGCQFSTSWLSISGIRWRCRNYEGKPLCTNVSKWIPLEGLWTPFPPDFGRSVVPISTTPFLLFPIVKEIFYLYSFSPVHWVKEGSRINGALTEQFKSEISNL